MAAFVIFIHYRKFHRICSEIHFSDDICKSKTVTVLNDLLSGFNAVAFTSKLYKVIVSPDLNNFKIILFGNKVNIFISIIKKVAVSNNCVCSGKIDRKVTRSIFRDNNRTTLERPVESIIFGGFQCSRLNFHRKNICISLHFKKRSVSSVDLLAVQRRNNRQQNKHQKKLLHSTLR
ncbi:MAG: hypothetical protein BWY67_00618 [Bacteroidetes bacterium ADurb.Bin397]|nr:MAG: hypothetical protein BWY67_00618 [Bacteroidetes bacterium ADurb.Bin397]